MNAKEILDGYVVLAVGFNLQLVISAHSSPFAAKLLSIQKCYYLCHSGALLVAQKAGRSNGLIFHNLCAERRAAPVHQKYKLGIHTSYIMPGAGSEPATSRYLRMNPIL